MTRESEFALAPPDRPLPAPRVTTGIFLSEQKAKALEISSVDRANKTALAGEEGANGAWRVSVHIKESNM